MACDDELFFSAAQTWIYRNVIVIVIVGRHRVLRTVAECGYPYANGRPAEVRNRFADTNYRCGGHRSLSSLRDGTGPLSIAT